MTDPLAALQLFRALLDTFLDFLAPELLRQELDAAIVKRANDRADALEKARGLT